MNPFTTHGAISWYELLAVSPDSARDFYSALLGWNFEEMPMGPEGTYHLARVGDVNVGGVMKRPHDDIPPNWTLYVTVDDVRGFAESDDLHVVVPVTDTPVGPFCGIMDPQGAYIQAIQYAEGGSEGASQDYLQAFRTHGMFSWFELRTSDPAAAADWYSKVFGWTIEEKEIPTGTYRTVKVGEVGFGGIARLPVEGVPPHWCAYVTVDDVDAVVATAPSLGGTVLFPPMDIPHVGRMTQIMDPEGAQVVVITYVPWEG